MNAELQAKIEELERLMKAVRSGTMVYFDSIAATVDVGEMKLYDLEKEWSKDICKVAEYEDADAEMKVLEALWNAAPDLLAALRTLSGERDAARADGEELRKENERLHAILNRGSGQVCAYCATRFGKGGDGRAQFAEHVKTCTKHPMHALLARLAAVEAELERLRSKCDAEVCAHNAGFEACTRGAALTDNPHSDKDDDLELAWATGWLERAWQIRAEQAEAERDAMKGLLRECEWAERDVNDAGFCPACLNGRDAGHAPDCKLAAALAERK